MPDASTSEECKAKAMTTSQSADGQTRPDAPLLAFRRLGRVAYLPSDFRRQIGPVEHRRFLDIVRGGARGRILGGVPQRFGGGVQAILGLVSRTAGVVRQRWNLPAAIRARIVRRI